MVRIRTRAGALALGVALLATGCKFTGWGTTSVSKGHTARNWLVTQQQADGGFEVSGFAGFETPDAILAIAEDAQQQLQWNTGQARTAVATVQVGGKSALDAIDDFADGTLTAGQAAKLVVLVAEPLGYDPTTFNPQNDGTSRNLLQVVDAAATPGGSYGAFNATLYVALAKRLVDGTVPAATVAYIRAAQQADGGWDYAADPTGADADVDTTSLAVQALVAGGATRGDADVTQGLQYLANQHQASGAWQSFGADDPNSTSTAILAVTAVGEDVTGPCWRNRAVPGLTGQPYVSPATWLRNQVANDGHIASPNDAFPPVNTFATSQGIEAMRRGWLPVTWLDPLPC